MKTDPKLRQSIADLLKIYDGNRSEVARVLHIGRGTVAEVADSKEVQNNTEDTDDPDEYPGESNEMKHEIETLEKENQAILAELTDVKSENERMIKKSEKAWHQQQQQQQNSVPPKFALAQDILCKMLKQKRLPPSFLKYVDVHHASGRNRDREQYIHKVRKEMSENFLQLKYSLPTIESLICELSSVGSDNEIKQACASMIRRTDFVTNEIKALSTIPINHPSLHIIPDEIALRLLKDTTMLADNVFPKLRPAVAVVRTSGKESKYFANIAAALGDFIRIISKIDVYFAQYLIGIND